MESKTGVVVGADGSCRLKFLECEVLASVHGPSPNVTFKQTSADESHLRVFIKQPWNSVDNALEKSLEVLLKRIVRSVAELCAFPRTKLNISVLLISKGTPNDGYLKACVVNAVVFALLDSGIPLSAFPIAVADKDTFCVLSNSRKPTEHKIFYVETQAEEQLEEFLQESSKIMKEVESQCRLLFS